VLSRLFEPIFTTKGKGKGTVVSVYLPRVPGAAKAPEKVSQTAVAGGTETVLGAEDEAEMLARKTREALDSPVPSEPMVSGP